VSRDKGILVTKKLVFRQVAPMMPQHYDGPGLGLGNSSENTFLGRVDGEFSTRPLPCERAEVIAVLCGNDIIHVSCC
jgi:hypothetical protein